MEMKNPNFTELMPNTPAKHGFHLINLLTFWQNKKQKNGQL
jgi:hypothetical protein